MASEVTVGCDTAACMPFRSSCGSSWLRHGLYSSTASILGVTDSKAVLQKKSIQTLTVIKAHW